MNLILTNVREEREIQIDDYKLNNTGNDKGDNKKRMMKVDRRLSQAMVPGSRIIKVEIEQSIHGRAETAAAGAVPSF